MHSIHSEKRSASRLLYSSWMISGLVLSTLLSSIFYSSLTVPSFEPAVDTIADIFAIATSDRRYLLCKDGTSLFADFMNLNKTGAFRKDNNNNGDDNHDQDVYHQIGLHMLRNGQQMLSQTEHLVTRAEESRRNVVLAMRLSLVTHRQIQATKPLHISSENLESITTSVALQKGAISSVLMGPFNFVIDSLREAGIFDYLLQSTVRRQFLVVSQRKQTRYSHTMTGNPLQEAFRGAAAVHRSIKVVTLFEVSSLFHCWASGLAVSVVTFSGEHLFRRCSLSVDSPLFWCTKKGSNLIKW